MIITSTQNFISRFKNPATYPQVKNVLTNVGTGPCMYSLQKLEDTYSGSAIEVVRSSDDQTLDIGFDDDGEIDVLTLESFAGPHSLHVSKWYDQSGNNNHAVANVGERALIVENGEVKRDSYNRPALYFNGTDNVYYITGVADPTEPYSLFANVQVEGSFGTRNPIISKWDTGGLSPGFTTFTLEVVGNGTLGANENHDIVMGHGDGFGIYYCDGTIQATPQIMTPIAGSNDGDYISIFHTGTEIEREWKNGGPYKNNYDITIGASFSSNSIDAAFEGYIQTVLYYDRYLTNEEQLFLSNFVLRRYVPPFTITRQHSGTPAVSASDVNASTILWFNVYTSSAYPEVDTSDHTGGSSDYFALWSTDHDSGPGGIWWGTFNNLDISDLEERGLLFDGNDLPFPHNNQAETPFLVRNLNDPNGRTLYLYFHPNGSDNGGTQETTLSTSSGGKLDSATWIFEGAVMPSNAARNHTGYATIYREADDRWFAWTLSKEFSPPSHKAFWTSENGLDWTLENSNFLATSVMPDGWRINNCADLVKVNNIRYWIGHRSYDWAASTGTNADGGSVIAVKFDLNEAFEPYVFDIWTPNFEYGETDKTRCVTSIIDDSDVLHVYWQTDQNVWHGTADLSKFSPEILTKK